MNTITVKISLFSCLLFLVISAFSAGQGKHVILSKDDSNHVYRAYDTKTDETLAYGVAEDAISAKQQLKDLESVGVENLDIEIKDDGGSFVTKLFRAKQLLNFHIYMHDGKSPSLQPELFLLSVFKRFQFFLDKLQ